MRIAGRGQHHHVSTGPRCRPRAGAGPGTRPRTWWRIGSIAGAGLVVGHALVTILYTLSRVRCPAHLPRVAAPRRSGELLRVYHYQQLLRHDSTSIQAAWGAVCRNLVVAAQTVSRETMGTPSRFDRKPPDRGRARGGGGHRGVRVEAALEGSVGQPGQRRPGPRLQFDFTVAGPILRGRRARYRWLDKRCR
jgi:hypothetical protein